MHTGEPRRLDYLLSRRVLAKARDIFSDRAVKQFNVLRKVSNRLGERLRRVMRDQRLIKADFAARSRPGAYEGAHQGRLAATTRSNDAERVAGLDLKRHARHG